MTTPVPPIALAGEPDLIKRICDAIREAEGEAYFLLDWEDCIKIIETFAAPTPSTQAAGEPVSEFEALCDLIPEDAYWGMPLTPDLVRYIRASLAAPSPSASSVPVAWTTDHDSISRFTRSKEVADGWKRKTKSPMSVVELFAAPPASPAPSELTDEQILELAVDHLWIDSDRVPYRMIEFARALLQANGATND